MIDLDGSFRVLDGPPRGGAWPQEAIESVSGTAPILRVASIVASRPVLARAEGQLTAAERIRSSRFFRQADRERFALGRWMARSVIGELLGIDAQSCAIDIGSNGKPYLRDGPDVAFNIAHSGDLVFVGAGRGIALGVDVECHRSEVEWEGVGRMVFAEAECDHILDGSPDQRMHRFFRQWTLKEALVKALGTGLMLDPRRFSIDPTTAPLQPVFVGAGMDDIGPGWLLDAAEIAPGYSAAIAWRSLDSAPATGITTTQRG